MRDAGVYHTKYESVKVSVTENSLNLRDTHWFKFKVIHCKGRFYFSFVFVLLFVAKKWNENRIYSKLSLLNTTERNLT